MRSVWAVHPPIEVSLGTALRAVRGWPGMRQARRDGFPLSWGMTSPALLYGCTGTWLNAPVPQTPIWAFIVVFVLINTFITGGDITVTARTNFVLLGLELVALTVFIA